MCMEGVRLGRKTMYRCTSYDVTTSAAFAIPYNSKRVALRFSTNHASAICLAIAGDPVTGQSAASFSNGGGGVVMDIQRDGAIVMAQFSLIATVACIVYVIETFLEDE